MPHLLDHHSFGASFEIGMCESPNFVLTQDCLAIMDPLNFHMKLRINLSISAKKPAGILIGNVLDLQIALVSIATLTILKLLIHEHAFSFI